MKTRQLLGVLGVLVGAAGLVGAIWVDAYGTDTGIIAAVLVAVLAAGLLEVGAGAGPVELRVTGGLLFLFGIAVIVTQHQMWYWMPNHWVGPVTLASLLVSIAGLAALLFGRGLSLAGLSGGLGVLAFACLMLTVLPLPNVGSYEQDVLRVVATAFGATALTAGVMSAARLGKPARWKAPILAIALLGSAVTVFTAFDSYNLYAPDGHHALIVIAAILGVAASLALGLIFASRPRLPSEPRRSPEATRSPEASLSSDVSLPAATEVIRAGGPAPQAAVPAYSVSESGAATGTIVSPQAAIGLAPSGRGGFLQTAAIVVGLITGVITIAKELTALARTLLE